MSLEVKGWLGLFLLPASSSVWVDSLLYVDQGKQSNVVYNISCSCGQVYIGETKRRWKMRLKAHWDACKKGITEKSAVADHAWKNRHPIYWEEMAVLGHGRVQELLVKETLHI